MPAPGPGRRTVGVGDDVVVVHPGSASPARRWPLDRWAAVVRGLRRDGARVVLSGGGEERAALLGLAADAGLESSDVVAGRLDVLATARLVAQARLLVAVDTGVAHLATAYGTPSVVAFGPVGPQRWGPPPGRRQHVPVWAGPASEPDAATCAPALLGARAAGPAGAGPPAAPGARGIRPRRGRTTGVVAGAHLMTGPRG